MALRWWRGWCTLVGVAVACDQGEAFAARVQPHAPQHPPHAVLGDPNTAPLLPAQLSANPAGPEPGVGQAERHDPLLQVRPDFIGLPWPAALTNPQRLDPPTIGLVLEPVVGLAAHPHPPASLRNVPELLGEREQTQ